MARAEEKVAQAQAKVDQRQGKLNRAKEEKAEAQAAIDAIEARKTKLRELREEQARIEEFYSTPDAEGKRKNRSKKYEGVSMRPQDIARKVQDLERASVGDDAALESWTEKLRKASGDIRSYTG